MRKHALASLLAAPAILTGCGKDDDGPKGSGIIEIVQAPGAPASYRLADADCQAERPTAPLALTTTTVPAWDGEGVAKKPVTFTGVTSDDSLASAAVSLTRYGDVFQRVCDLSKPEGQQCDGPNGREQSWVGPDPSTPTGKLRVCKDGVEYPRDTFEGVGLTSLHYVEEAHASYQKVARKPLPQIKLYVLPQFIDYYDNFVDTDGRRKRVELQITHNLAYFPGSPLIVVFPERKDEVDAPGFLWESAFVLAHEYGHHIDFSHRGQVLEAEGLAWSPERHGFLDLKALAQSGNADSERAQIQGAYAEAFADLLAFYAEGGTSRTLVGLKCFGKNRDVARDQFAGGLDKILTDDRLELLLGRGEEVRDRTDCAKPRFGDIHTGGAILAHTLDRAFQAMTKASAALTPGSEQEVAERYRLTLALKDELVKSSAGLTETTRGADLLAPLAGALTSLADGYFKRISLRDEPEAQPEAVKAEICRLVADRLPVIQPPFALTGGGCAE